MEPALYFTDCYLREFEAVVESVTDGKYVVLDKTAFYPVGGGQPHDTGWLIADGGKEYPVVFVGRVQGNISHEVAQPGLKAGDRVRGRIDWERRLRLMRFHTAMHIFCGRIFGEAGARITGNQLGLDASRADFELEQFDRERIREWERQTNALLAKHLPVQFKVLAREEALKIPAVSRLTFELPESVQQVRLVDVVGADLQACGGCHVNNTGEIGEIEVAKLDNKGKNNRRVYFRLKK